MHHTILQPVSDGTRRRVAFRCSRILEQFIDKVKSHAETIFVCRPTIKPISCARNYIKICQAMSVQTLHMDSPIESILYVGTRTLQVFHTAGLTTVGDLHSQACVQLLQKALTDMKENDEMLKNNESYWKGLATRVRTVIDRVRSDEARPIEPIHFLCPISWVLMEDPVVTKYGDSFERDALVKWVKEHGTDMYRRPMNETEIFENRNLREAIDYYRRHQLRFSVPIRLVSQ